MKSASLLYGSTELGSPGFSGDILWRSSFQASDPFALVETDKQSFILVSSLEFGRALKEAKTNKVVLLDNYVIQTKNKTISEALILFLKEKGIKRVIAPASLPYSLGKALAKRFKLEVRKPPFYPKRAKKTPQEIGEIQKAQHALEAAINVARAFLKNSKIRKKFIYDGSKVVTSQMLREIIDQKLFEQGFLDIGTIVASGLQAADPHLTGSGPLLPHSPIVIDVFPISLTTHYYADATRTFFKGNPSQELQKMYQTVLQAQKLALSQIKYGMDGYKIWKAVRDFFETQGYVTDLNKNPIQGFFHGVGHGIGIELHEPPYIGATHRKLEENNVVTVEPGLYYSQPTKSIPVGGIRIEDTVVVKKGGCKNLCKLPKSLDWAIIP